jgi:hypothetical protein
MKILLLGATGRTGKFVIEEAIRRGHKISAIARSPEKLKNYQIDITQGTPYDFETVEKAISGCEAVINTLNISRKSDNPWAGLASPNYSFNVSGLMKVFLDRLGFIFHRPRFFGKTFTSIVAQGVYGGDKISEYFNFIGKSLGFNIVKGCCLNSLEPMTEKDQRKTDMIIKKHSKRFYSTLVKKEYPVPTYFQLMIFRMARTSMKLLLNEGWRDFSYYNKNGWFESDYYYPVHLNPVKKMVGRFLDFLFARIYSKKVTENQFQPV